jgi:hypothetical protein
MGPFGRPPGEGPLPLGGLVTDETTSGLVVDKGTSRVVVDKGTSWPAVDKGTGRPAVDKGTGGLAVDDVLSGCTWRIPGKLADAVARCPDEVADHGPSSKPPWPSPPRGRMGACDTGCRAWPVDQPPCWQPGTHLQYRHPLMAKAAPPS